MEILSPLVAYYAKTLDDASIDVYFRALGGYTESQLERAVEAHIDNGRYFPRVPDLRKRITGYEEQGEEAPKGRIIDDPNFVRHHMAAERMFGYRTRNEQWTEHQGQTFLFPLEPIVDAGMNALDLARRDGLTEHLAMSYAHDVIFRRSISAYERRASR